jgi:hypothetical protein
MDGRTQRANGDGKTAAVEVAVHALCADRYESATRMRESQRQTARASLVLGRRARRRRCSSPRVVAYARARAPASPRSRAVRLVGRERPPPASDSGADSLGRGAFRPLPGCLRARTRERHQEEARSEEARSAGSLPPGGGSPPCERLERWLPADGGADPQNGTYARALKLGYDRHQLAKPEREKPTDPQLYALALEYRNDLCRVAKRSATRWLDAPGQRGRCVVSPPKSVAMRCTLAPAAWLHGGDPSRRCRHVSAKRRRARPRPPLLTTARCVSSTPQSCRQLTSQPQKARSSSILALL